MSKSFNPRPRAGGDFAFSYFSTFRQSFNPRPRAGGDLMLWYRKNSQCRFNPRPRAGGDVTQLTSFAPTLQFQSTPPRGGRRYKGEHTTRPKFVSIHAPARGATNGLSKCTSRFLRFNPRPRAGGDVPIKIGKFTHYKFQSTPPRGGRPMFYSVSYARIVVSIHAPARGATFGVLLP